MKTTVIVIVHIQDEKNDARYAASAIAKFASPMAVRLAAEKALKTVIESYPIKKERYEDHEKR